MTPKRIVIHCSASPNDRDVDISEITQWHLDRGFKTVGYHAVIKRDGTIQMGRPTNVQGAHVEGGNEESLGICLVGTDKFTGAQWSALRQLLNSWLVQFSIPTFEIYCHYEFLSAQKQGKQCPNIPIRNILAWYFGNDLAISKYLCQNQ